MSLDEIAIEMGTDKSSLSHAYTQYYEMFFESKRNNPINILEIGIDEGNSLKMWQRYFINAEIHGIDIRGNYEYLHDGRTYTHIVDQSDKKQLFEFGQKYNDFFNIIIDDGSHMSTDMILSFQTLFPYLKSGGYYIIEDLLCDFDERWNKGESIFNRIKQMVGEVQMNGKIPNSHICANKHEAVKKYDANYYEKHIEWIFVGCGFVIIKKM